MVGLPIYVRREPRARPLQFANVHRAESCIDVDLRAAGPDASIDRRPAARVGDGDGKVARDVAEARARLEVRVQIRSQTQSDVAESGREAPIARDVRTGARFSANGAESGPQRERFKPAARVNVAEARVSVNVAVDVHDVNLPEASAESESRVRWNLEVDVDGSGVMKEMKMLFRDADANFDALGVLPGGSLHFRFG